MQCKLGRSHFINQAALMQLFLSPSGNYAVVTLKYRRQQRFCFVTVIYVRAVALFQMAVYSASN